MASARAAVWRDRDGRAVKTTTDELYCLNPRSPRDLAARTDDGEFETVLRCRDCANCRRYDERALRRRLAETYREVTDDLWMLVVEAPLEEHAGLGARVRRRKFGHFEPALYRLGDSAFALVARGERPALRGIRALRARTYRVEALGRRRKPREFRALARGMLGERAAYGARTNRFYHRGLTRLPHAPFVVEKRGGIRKRHPDAKGGVRAWKRGLSLYPSIHSQAATLLTGLIAPAVAAGDRKCTHEKCPPERCRLAHRAAGARLPVNRRARVSAPSSSDVTGFRDMPAAHGAQGEPATGIHVLLKHPAGVPRNPKTNSNEVTGGRDAGSPHLGSAFTDAWLERMRKIARERDG